MQGIYQIRNKQNGKKYIGSSTDIKDRWRRHRSRLERNKHRNPHLQNSYNKYGKKAFIFEILEETDDIFEREQWYLDSVIEWKLDYNIAKDAVNPMRGRELTKEHREKISKNHGKGMLGKHHTEEAKRKMSEARRGENHHMWGKHLSEEHKRKLRGENSPCSKLTEAQVWKIHTLYATGSYTQKEIAEMFLVTQTNISSIVRGVRWPHIYKKYKEKAR